MSKRMDEDKNKHTLCKAAIRKDMRAKRRELSELDRKHAELGLAKSAQKLFRVQQANKLLTYIPFAGEISPSTLVNNLTTRDIWAPRITNFRTCSMLFYPAQAFESINKYGIVEPQAIGIPSPANAFDVILLPLVAFDRKGSRVGMGAGYYDRALSSLAHQNGTRPFLVGLAHHFQEINSLEPAPWDVPLDAILTDLEYIPI